MIVRFETGETCPACKAKVAIREVAYMFHNMKGCHHMKQEVILPKIEVDERNKTIVYFR